MSDRKCSIFMIRSLKGGAGKSTVALLLGAQAVKAGQSAVIVDLDVAGSDLADFLPPGDSSTGPVASPRSLFDHFKSPEIMPERSFPANRLPVLRISLAGSEQRVPLLPTYPIENAVELADKSLERRHALAAVTSCNTELVRAKVRALLRRLPFTHFVLDLEPFHRDFATAVAEAVNELGGNDDLEKLGESYRVVEIWVTNGDARDVLSLRRVIGDKYNQPVGLLLLANWYLSMEESPKFDTAASLRVKAKKTGPQDEAERSSLADRCAVALDELSVLGVMVADLKYDQGLSNGTLLDCQFKPVDGLQFSEASTVMAKDFWAAYEGSS